MEVDSAKKSYEEKMIRIEENEEEIPDQDHNFFTEMSEESGNLTQIIKEEDQLLPEPAAFSQEFSENGNEETSTFAESTAETDDLDVDKSLKLEIAQKFLEDRLLLQIEKLKKENEDKKKECYEGNKLLPEMSGFSEMIVEMDGETVDLAENQTEERFQPETSACSESLPSTSQEIANLDLNIDEGSKLETARKCLEERLLLQIEELKKENEDKKKECYEAWMCLQDTNRDLEKIRNEFHFKSLYVSTLENKVTELQKEKDFFRDIEDKLQGLKDEHARVSQEMRNFSLTEVNDLSSAIKVLASQYDELQKKYTEESRDRNLQYEELKKKYMTESKERKQLYNELLELKGNIRVFCRCRPLSAEEKATGNSSAVEYDRSKDNELYVNVNSTSKKNFKFDRVFTPEDTQEDVFAETAPIVSSVLDGYNVCIFAYGQTGTGKTFTMEGRPENRGVNYRTLEELFRVAEERKGLHNYDISVSVLEVYNEQIRDLLSVTNQQQGQHIKRLEIRQLGDGGAQHVPGLVEAKVNNMNEVWEVLQTGSAARAVGSTNANEMSSRSHCILSVVVKAMSELTGNVTTSKMWLVDLAGSERIAKTDVHGERLKEAQCINKSLSALGDVISALTTKSSHVPYRNSKLTHLLQDSLGGDAKSVMFVQISPLASDVGETLCSLNFASRVRGVEFGPIKKQQDAGEAFKYKQMVEKIKHDGKEAKKLEESLQVMETKFKAREQMCRSLQEKLKEVESQLAKERKMRQQYETKAREIQRQSDKAPDLQGPPPIPRRVPTVKNNVVDEQAGGNCNLKQQHLRVPLRTIDNMVDREHMGTTYDKKKGRYSICAFPQRPTPRLAPPRRVSMIPPPPLKRNNASRPEPAAFGRMPNGNIRNARRPSIGNWGQKASAIPMPRRRSVAIMPHIADPGIGTSSPVLQPSRSQFVMTPNKNNNGAPVLSSPVSLRGVKTSHALDRFRQAISNRVKPIETHEGEAREGNLNFQHNRLSDFNAFRLKRLGGRATRLPPQRVLSNKTPPLGAQGYNRV